MSLLDVSRKKAAGQKISVLTAYDAPMARLLDQAGIDVIVVNDGVVGAISMGRTESFSTTIDEMIYHTRAVKAASGKCAVISSMTFGSYNLPDEALQNAMRLVREGGAEAVHIEGDRTVKDSIKRIVDAGIAVIGHIGLTKQIIARTGQTRVQAQKAEDILNLFRDAQAFVEAGVSGLVLECVPEPVAEIITNSFGVLTIGIGAGRYCDGQFLVTQDILGMHQGISARFLKYYANLSNIIVDAVTNFRMDVEQERFPEKSHTYGIKHEELAQALALLNHD